MLSPRSVVGVPLENPGSATTSIVNMMILAAATAQTRPSKVCLWQVWEVPSGGDQ